MSSREEILANFQACTGIEDLEVAILQLEEANWDLQDAVNKAIPAEPAAAERPPIGPVPGPPTATSATSTPEEPIASYSPFSSAGVASRPPLATIGQPPIPIQRGVDAESISPPILIDDSPTISAPFSRAGISIADDFFRRSIK